MKAKTNVKFSDNVQKFAELAPGVGQQEYQEFICSSLVTCTKNLFNSNSFVIPAAKQKGHKYNIVKMKYKDFNKLRTVTTKTETLFYNELLLFNECLTNECHMCHGIKAKAIEICNFNGKITIVNIKTYYFRH